jgi:hypothetical protein
MAKFGADHEFSMAAIANLDHGWNRSLGLGNRRTPEFLRCVVDNLGHVISPSHSIASQ